MNKRNIILIASIIVILQVCATKGKRFCVITYGLSESEAEEVFDAAGFDTLATDGILYLNHDNY